MLEAINHYIHENGRKVDYLIIEGTMMGGRKSEKVLTEKKLQKEAKKILSENKYVFLVISSTNLDSLASFYHAAVANKRKILCYSYYLLAQLKTFTKFAGARTDLYKFENVYTVQFDKELYCDSWVESKTQEQVMRECGFLCIIKPEERYAEWIQRFGEETLIIYSMWEGYLNPDHKAAKPKWIKFFEPYEKKKQLCKLHTSGHATVGMLEKVIKAVDPQKEIIPMHTEDVEGFRKLLENTGHGKKLRI